MLDEIKAKTQKRKSKVIIDNAKKGETANNSENGKQAGAELRQAKGRSAKITKITRS